MSADALRIAAVPAGAVPVDFAGPTAFEAALAAVPERRDFAFSADLRIAAWIVDEVVEWVHDDGRAGRLEPGVPLPPGTHIEHLDDLGDRPGRFGICRPTDAGVELLLVEQGPPVRRVVTLATPRTALLPRLPGAGWQLLAVTDFTGACVLFRIDWTEATFSEAGRLPNTVHGGVWLDPGRRLALNVVGPSERTSVYSVDLEANTYSLLFEASPESDDRAVACDPATGRLVVTSDVFGYPRVGVAGLADGTGVRFLDPLGRGDEAGTPVGFVDDGRRLLLRHEEGVHARLRLADLDTLTISEPLPVADGEVGVPVVTDGRTVRFPFSAPDRPWAAARFDLSGGSFRLDDPPDGDGAADVAYGAPWVPARATELPGPSGPMPALLLDAAPSGPDGAADDLVVVALHGGPIARWGGEFHPEHQLLARLGIPVVALDYPGSTGWGQDYMRRLFGRAGSVDVEAVASVVDALADGGRRVILYGESYGAFLALATAAVRPCAGVIAFAPFASFESLRATGSPEVRDVLELLDGGNPHDSGRNLLRDCRTNRGKVLLVHGTADRTIPIGEARALAQALRDRLEAGDDDVRFVELEGQGHELEGDHVLQQWYREIVEFVAGLPASRSPAQRSTTSSRGAEQAASRHQPERR